MSSAAVLQSGHFMVIDFIAQRKQKNPQDQWFGFGGALLVHLTILLIGGAILIKPVEFGVDRGMASMEVQLVAGSAEPVESVPEIKQEVMPEPIVNPDAVPVPEEKPVVEQKSAVVGNSAVNAVSVQQSGATQAEPSYLKNPAPRYPYEARQKGWQGIVELKVLVNKNGQAQNIEVLRSSGHKVLDQEALKTVKNWQFRPARLGGIEVESSVVVPVRFDLKKQ
jgi:TonB family protein